MTTKPTADKFWMVSREQSPITKHRHQFKVQAVEEAERLAAANPGQIFYVLKTTAAMVCENPPVNRLKLKSGEIPF